MTGGRHRQAPALTIRSAPLERWRDANTRMFGVGGSPVEFQRAREALETVADLNAVARITQRLRSAPPDQSSL